MAVAVTPSRNACDGEHRAGSVADRPPNRLAFGITLDQVDQLDGLLRTITATGDVIAIGTAPLDDRSLPALGEVIFNAAREVRGLLDQVYAQRLAPAAAAVAPAVPQADRPAFASELHARLLHARSLLQVMKAAAAHRADGAEDLAAGCQAIAEMLGGVIEGLEALHEMEGTNLNETP